MFSENLQTLRKAKGLSQEELAAQLNVVRQTISKWEKGRSVPSADQLVQLAEILGVSTETLLNASVQPDGAALPVAQQLALINEQLNISNRRSQRVWKTIAIVLAVLVALRLLPLLAGFVLYHVRSDVYSTGTVEEVYPDETAAHDTFLWEAL